MKRIIIFLGLFIIVGAFSIGGHWPSSRGAVVLPRPDLVAQTTSAPAAITTSAEHPKISPKPVSVTPSPTATPVAEPIGTPWPSVSPQPSPSPQISPTPVPVDTPIPSPRPTCPPCGGYGNGNAAVMCPMIMCEE